MHARTDPEVFDLLVDLVAEESGGEVTLRRPTGTSRLIVPMPSREVEGCMMVV